MIGAMRPTIPSETQLVAAGGKRGWWVGKLFEIELQFDCWKDSGRAEVMAVLASFVERVGNTSSGFCVVATKVSFVVSCHPNWHWFQTRLCRATHYMVWFNHGTAHKLYQVYPGVDVTEQW
jgi:hypothetical protein